MSRLRYHEAACLEVKLCSRNKIVISMCQLAQVMEITVLFPPDNLISLFFLKTAPTNFLTVAINNIKYIRLVVVFKFSWCHELFDDFICHILSLLLMLCNDLL